MILVKIFGYVMFGFFMEVFFVMMSKFIDGKIRGKEIYLEGHTYLWMAPVYGILFIGIFEPVHALISNFDMVFRWVIWGVSFTFFEGLFGYIYDKILGFCPWDYSGSKWKVFKNGYTKWSLIPLWGIAGLIIEGYSTILIKYSGPIWNTYVEFLNKFWTIF